MIHNKQKLHAIGNYLKERFGYEWYFVNTSLSNTSTININDISVLIRVTDKDFIVSNTIGNDTIARRFTSPMQVVNYIITRKYEVK